MITRVLTASTKEMQPEVPFVDFHRVSVAFPDENDTTSTYNFNNFYPMPVPAEEGGEVETRTLQIVGDMYELSNFVAELQQALNYAMTRMGERCMARLTAEASESEASNEVPTAEADKS